MIAAEQEKSTRESALARELLVATLALAQSALTTEECVQWMASADRLRAKYPELADIDACSPEVQARVKEYEVR